MKAADFTRTEDISNLGEIEIFIEAKVKTDFDGAGQPLHEVFMELYTWEGRQIIDIFSEIYDNNYDLYKSLEDEALEKAE